MPDSTHVKTMGDILGKFETCAISCNYSRRVVRNLTREGDNVRINPGGGHPEVVVPASTPLFYEPWVMDRGSILFEHPDFKPYAKICGEGDFATYPDGSFAFIFPHPNLGLVSAR